MHRGPSSGAPGAHVSFTLVEILVAIAVLALLMLLVAKLTGSAERVSDAANRHADVSGEARLVLDRIGLDVNAMLLRPDVDRIFYKGTGNDACFFYSQVPGYFDPADATQAAANQSSVSLVGYRVAIAGDAAASRPVLQRFSQATTWTGANAMQYLSITPDPANPVVNAGTTNSGTIAGQWASVIGSAPYDAASGSPAYHTIGSQVFRLEFCFQNKDGSYAREMGALTNTAAIVVAVALLDDKSRLQVRDFAGLVAALPDAALQPVNGSTRLVEDQWNALLAGAGFADAAGIPAPAASQIRVYQRCYPLNVAPSK